MTPERLAELEALAEKATPGEWSARDNAVKVVWTNPQGKRCTAYVAECNSATEDNPAHAKLIAAARTAIPELIAALREERVRTENYDATIDILEQMRRELTALQARVKALQAAGEKLAKYHHDTCSSELISGMPCSCGKWEWARAVKGE